jgi:hypothetical protein
MHNSSSLRSSASATLGIVADTAGYSLGCQRYPTLVRSRAVTAPPRPDVRFLGPEHETMPSEHRLISRSPNGHTLRNADDDGVCTCLAPSLNSGRAEIRTTPKIPIQKKRFWNGEFLCHTFSAEGAFRIQRSCRKDQYSGKFRGLGSRDEQEQCPSCQVGFG